MAAVDDREASLTQGSSEPPGQQLGSLAPVAWCGALHVAFASFGQAPLLEANAFPEAGRMTAGQPCSCKA